jgi:hypothetical protein
MQSAGRSWAKTLGASLLLTVSAGGCGAAVLAEYQASKAEGLGAPAELGTNWKPEVRVRLSRAVVESAVGALLEEGLTAGRAFTVSGPLGLSARLEPRLDVKKLTFGAAKACDRCVNARAALDGRVAYDLAGYRGTVPLHGELVADVSIRLERTGESWTASARVEDVQSIEVEVPRAGKLEVGSELEHWAKRALAEAPTIPLGTFGGGGLPIRALRVSWIGEALELEGATDVVGAVPVASAGAVPEGWSVSLDGGTVLALARRAAFERGALSHEVAVEPRALEVRDGGGFSLDLRLWKLAGAGWWRGYTVRGSLGLDGSKLVVRSDDVVETGRSRGAGIADPLALLVEGRILQALGDAFDRAVPLRTGSVAGLTPRASRIVVDGTRVTLEGTVNP